MFNKQGNNHQRKHKRSSQPLSACDYESAPVCDAGEQKLGFECALCCDSYNEILYI